MSAPQLLFASLTLLLPVAAAGREAEIQLTPRAGYLDPLRSGLALLDLESGNRAGLDHAGVRVDGEIGDVVSLGGASGPHLHPRTRNFPEMSLVCAGGPVRQPGGSVLGGNPDSRALTHPTGRERRVPPRCVSPGSAGARSGSEPAGARSAFARR